MKALQKTVFLDRDGVLIHDVHYLSKLTDIRFYPDVPEGLQALKKAGYLLVVVTNQSGVARGYFSQAFVEECHKEMNRILASNNARLDHLYFCPHHVDGEPPLNISCDCRKPAPGLILKAERELEINLDQAWMIGDKQCDVELAINAHIPGILLTTGKGEKAVASVTRLYPQVPVFPSFGRAVQHILKSAIG